MNSTPNLPQRTLRKKHFKLLRALRSSRLKNNHTKGGEEYRYMKEAKLLGK